MVSNLVNVKDYRNTSFRDMDFSLGDKKTKFMEGFVKDHSKVKNVHNTISKRDNKYNGIFRSIYYDKCVYCGISTQVIFSSNFEVDHVIPVSVLKLGLGHSPDYINGIENLVSSCQMCNRGKSGFLCIDENLDLLHPDKNILPLIFDRKEDYSLQINDKYKSNPVIQEFYDKLKLNNELRKLDYLLMEMKDFCEKHEGQPIKDDIQNLLIKLEEIRRKEY